MSTDDKPDAKDAPAQVKSSLSDDELLQYTLDSYGDTSAECLASRLRVLADWLEGKHEFDDRVLLVMLDAARDLTDDAFDGFAAGDRKPGYIELARSDYDPAVDNLGDLRHTIGVEIGVETGCGSDESDDAETEEELETED